MRNVFLATVLLAAAAPVLFGAGELSNRRAPSFSLPDSKLKQHDLLDYRGKIVLIDLMMTNCPHCKVFSKVLERVKARYGDKVAILSVVNYASDNASTVAQYVKENQVTAPILFDCGQVAASYMKLGVARKGVDLPHLFVIDGAGVIRNDYEYTLINRPVFEDFTTLCAEIDRLLAPARK